MFIPLVLLAVISKALSLFNIKQDQTYISDNFQNDLQCIEIVIILSSIINILLKHMNAKDPSN
jgi:hypothetical protein